MPTAISQATRHSFWGSVREALRGTEQDFTEGSLSRGVFLLATPMVLEMLMESLFAVVDVFWVTRLGPGAVATVGLTESLLSLIFAVAVGLSLATTAMVARRIGEKNAAGARTAAGQAILMGTAVALVMGAPGAWFGPQLLRLMGAPPDVAAVGHGYISVLLGGCMTITLLFLNNAIFRGAGDAAVAMRVLWFANAVNLALDPCLIFGLGPFPRLGVMGAAVATTTGRALGVAYQFRILFRGQSRIKLEWPDLKPVWRVIGSLARVSATGVAQFAISHTSWLALVRIISVFGTAALAGYTIGIRIFVFVILPAWGLSGAAATMVGQNLGAQKPDRAQRAVWLTSVYNAVFLAAVAAVFMAFPEPLVKLFTSDGTVVPHAIDCLRIVAAGNIAYALGMVLAQAFNGAGDTVTPTMINLVGFWAVEIPLAWILAFHAHMAVRGVFAAIPISETLITCMGLAMFLRGGWKKRKI